MRSKTVDRLLKSTPRDVEIFVDLYADLVVRINELLRERKLSRKELALRLDKQPSEISKWLSGEHNFTLRSLAKLSAELGEPLVVVPRRTNSSGFIQGFSQDVHTFVVYKQPQAEPASQVRDWQPLTPTQALGHVG